VGADLFHVDRQTDITNLDTFRNFTNASKTGEGQTVGRKAK